MSVVVFAVVPVAFARFVALIAYEANANLRNSTFVGIVRVDGIGGTLIIAGEVLAIHIKRVHSV